jgi:hypothetical protein
MHPALCARIVTESVAVSARVDNAGEAKQLPSDKYQLVETPQALLSRNPAALRILSHPYKTAISRNHHDNDDTTAEEESTTEVTAKPISRSHAEKLRQDVATALINESGNGKRMHRIREFSLLHNKRRRDCSNASDYESNKSLDNEHRIDADLQQSNQQPSGIHGTVSALNLIRFEQKMAGPEEQEQVMPILTTGCRQLDEMVALPIEHLHVTTRMEMNVALSSSNAVAGGGIPFRHVTQLSGPPSTGKTQMALQLACSPGLCHTWYLSSNAALPVYASRLSEMASHYHLRNSPPPLAASSTFQSQSSLPSSSQINHQPHSSWKATVLNRTMFATVTDEFQVLAKLAQLESFLSDNDRVKPKEQQDNENRDFPHLKPVLLVLDSCSGCLSSSESDDSRLLTVASTIKRLTRNYGLATVLINGTVANRILQPTVEQQQQLHSINSATATSQQPRRQRAHKPALGRSWLKTAADIHVWIDSLPNGTLRATLERHPAKQVVVSEGDQSNNSKPSQSATFRITSEGIQSVSS